MTASSTASEVAAFIEQDARNHITALNVRDFSVFKQNKAHNFTAEVGDVQEARNLGLNEMIESLKAMIVGNPAFNARIVDMTTSVYLEIGVAEVFINEETSGMPSGIIRRSISVTHWQLFDDRWLCVKHVSLPGVDGEIGD